MTQGQTRHTVTAPAIHNMLVNLITTAAGQLIQEGLEREKWIIQRVQSVVEDNDQLIPGLKQYVDLPWVDDLQAKGIENVIQAAVRKAYSYAKAKGILPEKTPTPPPVEVSEEDRKVAEALGVDPSTITPIQLSPPQVRPLANLSAPPAPDQSQPQSEDQGNEEPDYEGIAAEYKEENSPWYKFPPEGKTEIEEGDETVNKNGLAAAVEYLKTRDDLVYGDDE